MWRAGACANDANNHSLDFGATGQAQTVEAIHAASLAQTGLPGEITIVKAKGIKVAFLAFAPYNYDASLLDLPAARVLDMSVILHVTLSSAGRFERARIYPIQFTGQGRPVPGGGTRAGVRYSQGHRPGATT